MPINRWMDKVNVVYIYNGMLLAMKKNETLPFETTWMGLVGTTLSEISQIKTDNVLFYLHVE